MTKLILIKVMKCLFPLFLFLISLNQTIVRGQNIVSIDWQRCYGGSRDDNENAHGGALKTITHKVNTHDGGYIIAGVTSSIDGDIDKQKRHDDYFPLSNFNNEDIWIVKISSTGEIEWSQIYGGDNSDLVQSIIPTFDGGYALCGTTASITDDFYVDTTGVMSIWLNGGMIDGFILKIDSLGNKEWISRIGGSKRDFLENIIQASDGSYIAVGYTESNDELWLDLPWVRNTGELPDAFIVKLNQSGVKQWNKIYGGSKSDGLFSLIQKQNTHLLLFGSTTSTDVNREEDGWILEVDTSGEIISQKNYGGTRGDGLGISALSAQDGGYIVLGTTMSTDGDVIGYHLESPGIGHKYDAWIIKIDDTGRIVWQNCLGGSQQDGISSIIPTKSGGYAFIGYTNSSDSDLTGIHKPENAWDIWVGELSVDGKLLWQKCIGGTGNDYGNSIIETDDGFMVYGSVGSNDGDIVGNHGGSAQLNRDIWVAKLKTAQNVVEAGVGESHFAHPYPNPSSQEMNLRIHPTLAPQSVKFYDLLGQQYELQYTLSGNLLTAHTSTLPKGMYIIRITYPTGFQETRKFIVGE